MRALVPLVAAALLALVFPASLAGPSCAAEVTDLGGSAYAVRQGKVPGVFLVAVYAESNGAPGLQRGGEDLLGTSDPCPGPDAPDQLLAVHAGYV